MDPVQISIDVTDWAQEALDAEEVPQNNDDLVQLAVTKDWGAKRAAQVALAMRAAGHAPEDILPHDTEVLAEGGAYHVHHMVQMQKVRIERNGKQMEVRAFTAVQRDEDESGAGEQTTFETDAEIVLPERGYVEQGTPESVENAKRLLFRYVLGHVRNRLAEIWAGGGDVQETVENIVAAIRGIGDEIQE